jgi:hypothetical protein
MISVLHRIEIANFYSIRDPQIIDLLAASNAPNDPGRLAPVWRGASERAPKVVALFGANASGKSNVLKALSFLAWFARDSFQLAPTGLGSWLLFQRFNDQEMVFAPTRLAVYFAGPIDLERADDPDVTQCRYGYEVVLGGSLGEPHRVLRERLIYWPVHVGRPIRLFDRDEQGTVRRGRAFGLAGYSKPLQKVLRFNVSVICTLAQLGHPAGTVLWRAAGTIISNILVQKTELNDQQIAQSYAANPTLLKRLNRDLERIGLGVRAMQLQTDANGPAAWFEHDGLSGLVPALFESNGTRQFIRIFPLIFQTLESGGVAIIDELDLTIHPLILLEIIRWFHDPERNPHNAQLWMTCHNASLLEDLTKEEVLFCEKDAGGRSTIYSLRDVQAVRRDDNYYRKYLGGVYGAIPRVG